MATVFVMQRQLAAMKDQLLQLSVFSSGRPSDDEKADKASATLEGMAQQLSLMIRDLKSSAHLAQIQLQAVRKAPLDQRFSAKQSADQRARDAAALMAEAEKLKALVLDLLKKNGLLTPFQAAKNTMDLIEDLQKHLPLHHQAATQHSVGFPAYQPMPSELGEAHLDSVVPLVTLIYLGVKYLKQKYKSN